MSDVFFTADTHFGHRNILTHHPRRGASVDEMDAMLIERWNATVGKHDEVWHLGDFAMGPSANIPTYFRALNGRKHLVVGNHDHNPTKRLPWTTVNDIKNWRIKPHRAVLCHYPMVTWAGAHHGVWMLHGHSHGLLQDHNPTRMDVGVDTHPQLRPYHLDEIIDWLDGQEYRVVDAHG